ncbi:T9SS type A sorting domain-containing protein [Crocinitomix sp.]|nr:T9SS type A sorting domain-containing protein [Crocinitomix sp.]
MKKFILLFAGVIVLGTAFADDLEVIVIDSEIGVNSGQIDLTLNGGVGPFAYSWIGPDGFTSVDEDLIDLAPGTYTVTVSDKYCGVATLVVEVDEEDPNSSSIIEDNILDIVLYPNPSSGLFFINSNLNVDVVVYNVIGEQLFSGKNVKQVDLSNQPAGIYMVQMNTSEGTITRKITIQ